jgi:hypothetical protein
VIIFTLQSLFFRLKITTYLTKLRLDGPQKLFSDAAEEINIGSVGNQIHVIESTATNCNDASILRLTIRLYAIKL